MDYRITKQGDSISTIGIGGAHLHERTTKELDELVLCAMEQGVNLIDFATAYEEPIQRMGEVIQGRRDHFFYQMHLGLTFPEGQYERSRDLRRVREHFERQLRLLGTDHTDIAFLHCVDEPEDYAAVLASGMVEYAQELKREGKARYIGFASHTIETCHRFLADTEMDFCMFSVNPAYDLDPVNNIAFDELEKPEDQLATSKSRYTFYRECERLGVGMMIMKPYGGGILLDGGTSPFGQAMTIPQCLQYALDRPAAISCLLGVRTVADLEDALRYYTASKEERDYFFGSTLQHRDMRGTCVYCNHCLPCPVGIDIGAVHKYLDLTLAGDDLAREHYHSLQKNARDCIGCGSCEANCPFQVAVREKMKKAEQVMAL